MTTSDAQNLRRYLVAQTVMHGERPEIVFDRILAAHQPAPSEDVKLVREVISNAYYTGISNTQGAKERLKGLEALGRILAARPTNNAAYQRGRKDEREYCNSIMKSFWEMLNAPNVTVEQATKWMASARELIVSPTMKGDKGNE